MDHTENISFLNHLLIRLYQNIKQLFIKPLKCKHLIRPTPSSVLDLAVFLSLFFFAKLKPSKFIVTSIYLFNMTLGYVNEPHYRVQINNKIFHIMSV